MEQLQGHHNNFHASLEKHEQSAIQALTSLAKGLFAEGISIEEITLIMTGLVARMNVQRIMADIEQPEPSIITEPLKTAEGLDGTSQKLPP